MPKDSGKSIIALTVQEILDEEIAKNWREVFPVDFRGLW